MVCEIEAVYMPTRRGIKHRTDCLTLLNRRGRLTLVVADSDKTVRDILVIGNAGNKGRAYVLGISEISNGSVVLTLRKSSTERIEHRWLVGMRGSQNERILRQHFPDLMSAF